jgi:hypothetical protein
MLLVGLLQPAAAAAGRDDGDRRAAAAAVAQLMLGRETVWLPGRLCRAS